MNSWTDFEHTIWKKLKEESLDSKDQFILAVSGGLDSMVLVHLMMKLKPKARFVLVHYHHGDSQDQQLVNYRNRALKLVQEICQLKNITFYFEKSDKLLFSEDDYRRARWAFFDRVKVQYPDALLITAHHKDDLLETWLLKMIRGVGPDGLENFKFWNGSILRPLLLFQKSELVQYAEVQQLTWVEDPSNLSNDHLRNWLRNEWLKQLTSRVPAAAANLTQSLQKLIDEIDTKTDLIDIKYDFVHATAVTKGWFLRSDFLALSHKQQLMTLARLMKRLGQRDFSQGQLEEVIKRLDKNQKEHIFSVASVKWFINAQQVVLEYPSVTESEI